MQISPPDVNVTSLSVRRLQTRRYCNFQFSKKKAYLIIVCLFSSLVLKLPPLSGCSPEGGVGCMVFTVTYYIYALGGGGASDFSMLSLLYTLSTGTIKELLLPTKLFPLQILSMTEVLL